MSKSLDGIDFLARSASPPEVAVVALVGDAPFVQTECLHKLRRELLGRGSSRGASPHTAPGSPAAEPLADDGADFSYSTFNGETAEWRQVHDELSTVAMFGADLRLVVVLDADSFVTRYRAQLERYVASPARTAVLILVVGALASNTRLYKALIERGLIVECRTPAAARLAKWIMTWARDRHSASIDADAADLLVEMVEPELGLIDQELAKLAAMAGPTGQITSETIHQAVGGWRTKTTWDMLDAALAGDAAEAFLQLDRLLLGGEAPIAILAQIGSTLRRFAAATRLIIDAESARRRMTLREALESAGFKPFVISKAEGQVRRLGRQRAGELDRWLLEIDLELKGASSAPTRARTALESLIARITAQSTGPAASGPRAR